MAFWLASARGGQESGWIQRFDPRFWTVNFPRPMVAAVTVIAPDALRVDADFVTQGDLAGLIWDSADALDHPLLAYTTDRDYSGTTLAFRWRSSGVIALDAVNGPTLTIEGRDAAGAARGWYVRLWNYASGTPGDAQISLDFSALAEGFAPGGDAVFTGDIDRMFISLVGPDYASGSATPLAAAAHGWAELSGISCTGNRAMLAIGDVFVPPHGLCCATAFDDSGTQTPTRLIRNLRQLGYRGSVLHYVGMSHYAQLTPVDGGLLAGAPGTSLCTSARAWHAAFFAECAAAGLSPITSLSYELLAEHCPADWGQRAFDGDRALTGYVPPSTLLSPANAAAMAWLQSVAVAFVGLMVSAGVPVRFQVGEPWWWVTPAGRICLYDDAAKSALHAALGSDPVEIADLRATLTAGQQVLLDTAGALLAASTAAMVAAVRAAAAPQAAEALLLTFVPGVLDPAMPDVRRANLPVGWAAPAFNRLQIEDYDWLTGGADALRAAAYATVNTRLGYPAAEQDYLAGYVPSSGQAPLWTAIDAGADQAIARGAHDVFVWALPEICRDGYVRIPSTQDDDDMLAFDDISFPLALGQDAKVTPSFSTSIAVTASGFERRTSVWADARLRFDVGPGVRSEADIGVLLAFFRARRGAGRGFRLADPTDFSSNGLVGTPTAGDQEIGVGDGVASQFALVKSYGTATDDPGAVQRRRITRPRPGSVLVSVGRTVMPAGWALAEGGVISFTTPPAAGAVVRAGFLFDVPVRFDGDQLEISGAAFAAGEAPSVPLIEVREAV